MHLRRIQQTGGASYIVTLPKEWVVDNRLKTGDAVVLNVQEDGTILIERQRGQKSDDRAVVRVEDIQPERMFRKLVSLYMMARGNVELVTDERIGPRLRQTVRSAVRRLIGFEIVEETSNSIIIQDILNPSELSMPKSFRRMALLSLAMFNDSMTALRERDGSLAEDVVIRDDEVDRLHWLNCKQFNLLMIEPSLSARMNIRPLEAVHFRTASKYLERVADHGCRIAENVKGIGELGGSSASNIDALGTDVAAMLSDSTSAVLRRDFELANKVIEAMAGVTQARTKILKQIPRYRESAVGLAYIVESIERVASYSTDIAEVAIDLNSLGERK